MDKNWKYIIIAGVLAVIVIVAFLVMSSLGKPSSNGNNNSGQNTALSAEKELQAREFVKNFVSLYNSYRYADYTNLTALGDYQTSDMQQRTVERVSYLEQTVQPGFSKETVVNASTFKYSLSGENLEAIIEAQVTESAEAEAGVSPRQGENVTSYNIKATLKLLPLNEGWVVDEINIK